jgi:hypothetical protein
MPDQRTRYEKGTHEEHMRDVHRSECSRNPTLRLIQHSLRYLIRFAYICCEYLCISLGMAIRDAATPCLQGLRDCGRGVQQIHQVLRTHNGSERITTRLPCHGIDPRGPPVLQSDRFPSAMAIPDVLFQDENNLAVKGGLREKKTLSFLSSELRCLGEQLPKHACAVTQGYQGHRRHRHQHELDNFHEPR